MKPTVGRVVIYKTTEEDRKWMRQSCCNIKEELPAIIVAVWSETCVNLQVLLDGDGTMWRTSVTEGLEEYNWHWPKKE